MSTDENCIKLVELGAHKQLLDLLARTSRSEVTPWIQTALNLEKKKNMLACIQSFSRWKGLENMDFVLFYPVNSVLSTG